MVAAAAAYRWSSAVAHLSGLDATGSLDLRYWAARISREEWHIELGITEDPDELAAIRTHIRNRDRLHVSNLPETRGPGRTP